MKHQTLLIALALSLLAGLAPAQDVKSKQRGDRKRAESGDVFQSDGQVDEGATDEALNDPHAPRGGARGYCTFKGSVQPRRIAPGSSGTLVIAMMLQGNWIMTSPANMAFEFERQQGAISIGQPVLRPARPGTLDTVFRGQPVYDNIAIIDVPISVASDARYGDHRVHVRALFDIADGKTGNHFQRFMDTCGGVIEVGEPIPENLTPRLQSGPESPVRTLPESGAATAMGESPVVAATAASPTAGGTEVGARAVSPAGADPSGRVEPATDIVSTQTHYGEGGGGGFSWPLLVGIAGFGLVVLVLVIGAVKKG